jgi:hypothetical protein
VPRGYCAHVAFASAPALNALTSPLDRTPWPVFQNVRVDTAPRPFGRFVAFMPHATCGRMVSGSLHFPSRVLCSFHSRYYGAIGLESCLGFEVGAPDLRARFPTHATQKTRHHPPACPYRTITLSGAPFQGTSGSLGWVDTGSQLHIPTSFRMRVRIALFPLRSPLLRESH